MKPLKICVVTGSRAEYGLLRFVLSGISERPGLELQLVATGTHLSPEFGLTYREIEADGFEIHARVEMLLSADTPVAIAKSIGLGTIGFAEALERLRPDVLLILGDRFEILAVAQAALVARIPIAHIQGGESTEGAIDEAIRHAITKMSQLHFVATETYRKRVIQLGEEPGRVFNVGALGVDAIARLKLLERTELEEEFEFSFSPGPFLLTYHPATLESGASEDRMRALLQALESFPEQQVVITKANADTDGRVINQMVDDYASERRDRVLAVTSLGQLRYLSVMRYASAVIGNSSSGIIEAPALRVPTVNLGNRQAGRERAASVIDCENDCESIEAAISRALSERFRACLPSLESPYGEGGAAERILDLLEATPLKGRVSKRFHDLPR